MPKRGRVSIKRGYTSTNDDMLRTKYFCQITKKQLLEGVMEISAPPRPDRTRPPLRYVLVIDVSSSMKYKVGQSAESLLDRVKVFAELVIRKVCNKDSVGIISFAKDVKVEFPMTLMTDDSKSLALGIIRSLTVRGGTNLELGLMTGLKILKESPSLKCKDLIIIFTDGEANKGTVDADILIENYREAQSLLEKSSCVPISAFTIGHYVPVLLDKLAQHLGSDAFYWLNENEEFESDMLIPIFLREEARVTDVLVEVTCLEDVTIDIDSTYKTSQMKMSRDSISFFIHSFPQETRKRIPLRLHMPPHLKNEDQKKIADIAITYLDDEMNQRVKKDSLLLSPVVLSDIAKCEESGLLDSHRTMLNALSAYSIKNNVVNTSLKAAQKSLVSIADSKYKTQSMMALNNVVKSITTDEEPSAREKDVRGTVSEIHKINDDYAMVFNALDRKTSTTQLDDLASAWIEEIKFASSMDSKKSLGRLFAMQSSLNNEMPPAKGVFGPHRDRPFVPNKVEHIIRHYEKLVAATKEKRRKELNEAGIPVLTKNLKSQDFFGSRRDKSDKPKTMSELFLKSETRRDPRLNNVRTDTVLYCSSNDYNAFQKKEEQTTHDSSGAENQMPSETLPRINRTDLDQASDSSSVVDSLRNLSVTDGRNNVLAITESREQNGGRKMPDVANTDKQSRIDDAKKKLQEESGSENMSQTISLPQLASERQNVDIPGRQSPHGKDMHHTKSLPLAVNDKQNLERTTIQPAKNIDSPGRDIDGQTVESLTESELPKIVEADKKSETKKEKRREDCGSSKSPKGQQRTNKSRRETGRQNSNFGKSKRAKEMEGRKIDKKTMKPKPVVDRKKVSRARGILPNINKTTNKPRTEKGRRKMARIGASSKKESNQINERRRNRPANTNESQNLDTTKELNKNQKERKGVEKQSSEAENRTKIDENSIKEIRNQIADPKINKALVEIERRRGSYHRRESVREQTYQSMKELTNKPLTESERQKAEKKSHAQKKSSDTSEPTETEIQDKIQLARKSRLYGARRSSLIKPVEKLKEGFGSKAESVRISDGVLQTKYHCQVTKKKDVDLLMELTALSNMVGRQSNMRYVLVIDVGESMDSNVGRTSQSLLDRIKIFAEVVIQKMSSKDSLAIVTFSEDAKVDFPMKVMMSEAKGEAIEIVRAIESRSETNLELGIMTALNVLQGSSSDNSRDAIIIFTDGEPTVGQKDATVLVENYRTAQTAIGKSSYVPLIAFTVGKYVPILLNSLACQLGTESFYWLNENEEFERDMLIPLILRQTTSVTDVNIKMRCHDGVTFNADFTYKTGLMELKQTEMTNFIYSIPEDTTKHIPLRLTLTEDMLNATSDKDMVDVVVTYLDSSLQKRTINDTVRLLLPEPSEEDVQKNKEVEYDDVVAYSMADSVSDSTKEAAQDALSAIADSKCRVLSMGAISKVVNAVRNSDSLLTRKIARETILSINKINTRYKSLIEPDSDQYVELKENVGNWIARVNFSGTLQDKRSLGRLFSMKTSVENETPSARGVFDSQQRQPYLFTNLENKLNHYDKVVRVTKRATRELQHAIFYSESRPRNVLLSESLRYKTVGRKNETLWELIVKCGGRPVPNVNTMYHDTILVCDGKDMKQNTVLVQDAKRANIPIVHEQYIHDCVTQKMMISKLEPYLH